MNENFDYQKMFERLAEQIRLEYGWNRDMMKRQTGDRYTFAKGSDFAYWSILTMVEELEANGCNRWDKADEDD